MQHHALQYGTAGLAQWNREENKFLFVFSLSIPYFVFTSVLLEVIQSLFIEMMEHFSVLGYSTQWIEFWKQLKKVRHIIPFERGIDFDISTWVFFFFAVQIWLSEIGKTLGRSYSLQFLGIFTRGIHRHSTRISLPHGWHQTNDVTAGKCLYNASSFKCSSYEIEHFPEFQIFFLKNDPFSKTRKKVKKEEEIWNYLSAKATALQAWPL